MNVKLLNTKQRQKIYEIINSSLKPLTAKLIHKLINDELINLSTVYRNLDYFLKHNLINKTHIGKNDFFYTIGKEHKHFMYCKNCEQLFDIPCCFIDTIKTNLNKLDFIIEEHDLILYGKCKNCSLKI